MKHRSRIREPQALGLLWPFISAMLIMFVLTIGASNNEHVKSSGESDFFNEAKAITHTHSLSLFTFHFFVICEMLAFTFNFSI